MKIGFIGTGNMGRILIEAFIDSKAIASSSLLIYNRTVEKALHLKKEYSGITVAESELSLAKESDIIFICVKPHDVRTVINTILPQIHSDKCIVSITSPITVSQIQSLVPCGVARIIPSITNRSQKGATLYTFSDELSDEYRSFLLQLIQYISTPVAIEEKYTRIASDIVSCGPAFISYLLQQMITSAIEETALPKETATQLASSMIIGFGELLQHEFYTLETLQQKVCVKGGITGEGIKVLEEELGPIFNHVFQATQSKFEEDIERVSTQYIQE